jgi:hypothetical protein
LHASIRGKNEKNFVAYRHGVHRIEVWEQKSVLGIHLVHCNKGKRGFSLKIIEECEINQLGVRELEYMEKLGTFLPHGLNVKHGIDPDTVDRTDLKGRVWIWLYWLNFTVSE